MSLAYREMPRFVELMELVHNPALAGKLEALIVAHNKRLRLSDGLFSIPVHAVSVFLRSRGFTQAQSDLVEKLVKNYGMEVVMDFVLRERQFRNAARAALLVRPKEAVDLVAQMYERAVHGYEAFNVQVKDRPTLSEIMEALQPEDIALIQKLPDVRIVLPGLSRHKMVAAMNKKIGQYIRAPIGDWDFDDDRLWSNGQTEKNTQRSVVFVDGRESVPYNNVVQEGVDSHRQQVIALAAAYREEGFDVFTGAGNYLGLQMQALAEGQRIDALGWTALNAHVVEKDEGARLGCGIWHHAFGSVTFFPVDPYNKADGRLRLRAAIRVYL